MAEKKIPKFKPLQDRVVVRRDEPVTKIGSIELPDSAQERPQAGTVLAVGPGRYRTVDGETKLVPVSLKVLDRVLFAQYAGNEAKMLGDDILVMNEDDVLGVLE